jgi:hypothetical protein
MTAEELLVDYLHSRLHLFAAVTPADQRSVAVIYARDNELRQLIAYLRLSMPTTTPLPREYEELGR